MMGRQAEPEQLFYDFCFETHIPSDHLLRKVEAALDLSFVSAVLKEHYSHTGRPSVDPELMIRMLLVGYLMGIRSEHRLCDEVHLNLAYRWYCKLGLAGEVPDQSTFSKNRHGRFRESGIFRNIFEEVVRRCMEAGLVGGESMSVDGSLVMADANRDRRVPGTTPPEEWQDPNAVAHPVREYLEALDREAGNEGDEPKSFVPKYLSETDPAAAWSVKAGAGVFGYETNYLVDAAEGIIVEVEAKPARLSQEIIAAKIMVERAENCFALKPKRLAADTTYGTGPFLTWLIDRQVEPHIPVRSGPTNGKLPREHFTFDARENCFVCPEGHRLTYRGKHNDAYSDVYYASPLDCRLCPRKAECTSGPARRVLRHWDEEVRETVKALAQTESFARSRRERQKVEMRFAHLKQHLGLRRLKLRGLKGAAEEFTLAAAAQNLKALVKYQFPLGALDNCMCRSG
jgi:transposase